ncbi:MAG: PEP-CTERM sorting domain-containing protein [Phycisphaerae bacterium]|nr:PEP-CTERM sorting domain-containing protein [Phycisphaerae bacterium]
MSTSARLALLMVLTVLLGVDVCSAAIVPITSVVAGMNGKPPYTLESITVGDYTITKEFLAIGESTGESILFSDISSADDFDLNSVASRNDSGIWRVTNIGGSETYRDTNGDHPDFFLFEVGMNDAVSVQAIFADGTLGQAVTISQSEWGDTGLDRVGLLVSGQSIGGVAFSVSDLLDADGQALAADTVIKGLQFDSETIDPVHFSAAVMVPEPATLAILGFGGLFILRRRH